MNSYDMNIVNVKEIIENEAIIKDEPLEDIAESQKCGDIFLFDGKQFTLSCYFCSILFTEYEMFTNHILEDHAAVLSYVDSEEEPDYETIIEEAPAEETWDDNSMENSENLLLETEEAPTTESPRYLEYNANATSISCDLCTKSFRTTLGLSRHKKNHKTKTSQKTEISTKKTKERKIKTKKHNCNECDLIFSCRAELKVHERIHTGEMPFQCETCKKCFRLKPQLKKHMFTHTNSRPYKCSYCPSAFNHPTNLTVHIRRIHLDEKRHKCDFCEKAFVTSSDKNIHMRLHTDERPYQCEECGSKFRLVGQMTMHKRVRHSEERNFGCKECGKRFKTKKILNSHMVTHSDEKPFECETCGATFPRKRALISHNKLHSDIKEYVCKLCGKEFAQNAGLYSHMKSHKVDN